MFGETDSESPRMPSPWEAITASSTPSPSPSPLVLSTRPGSTSSLSTSVGADLTKPHDASTHWKDSVRMPYLDKTVVVAENIGSSSTSASASSEGFPKLVPEVEEGNVEYKLKLVAPTPPRFTRLVTQLKYRLLEGGGQALYEIGVSDSGELVGLTREDLDSSLDTLDRMAGELGATVIVLKEIELPDAMGVRLGVQRSFFAPPPHKPTPAKKVRSSLMSPGTKTKKERDREARRTRRAAALIIGDTTDGTKPSDSLSPTDSGIDLSQTLGTAHRELPIVSPSQPMPIIRPYPYGCRPFSISRAAKTGGRSLESESGESVTNSLPQTSSLPQTHLSPDEYAYSAPLSSESATPIDKTFDGLSDGDDVDPVFGFSLDVDIVSFTADVSADTPSLDTKAKPLHYSSFGSHSDKHSPQAPQALGDEFLALNPLQPPGKRRKPIIPPPPIMDPTAKAIERRIKRDAKREEKKVKPSVSVSLSRAPETIPSKVMVEAVTVTVSPVVDATTGDAPAKRSNTGPRVIAEALVVRKLASDEAFLDFGGFGLIETEDEETESGSGSEDH
ncbi:hypothetical protein FRB99_006697 [Tulasnella sp. 403]|nr:hypothetical protein FRB99_006697 [Tulasnella sp. 403]